MAFLFNWATMEPDEYGQVTPAGSVVQLGERNYLQITGNGEVLGDDFQQQAAAMLKLGEFLTTATAHGIQIDGARNFVHYPLLVNWQGDFRQPHQHYQLMMKQPNFMPAAAVTAAKAQLQADQPLIGEIDYVRFAEGLEAQVSQTGLATTKTFDELAQFVKQSPFDLDTTSGWHRELYLNFQPALPVSDWQVVLRQSVKLADPAAAIDYPVIIN